MQRTRFTLVTVACAIVLLASLPATAASPQVLSGHVPQAVSASQVLSAVPPATQLNLAIGLPLRNQEELDSLLPQLSDPTSPNFRHYLTPEQFAAEFGPTEQDYQALINFAQEKGLVVTGTHPNRMLLDVAGAVLDVENAFQVKMMTYKHPVRGEFYAPDREPSLDLDTQVLNIGGLNNFVVPQPMNLNTALVNEATPLVTGSGPYGYFIGNDFRAAYAAGVSLTGTGQVVGLLEYDGFFAGDVTKNAAAAGLPAVPTQTVLLDGFNGTPGSSNIEVILDIMMASYMAPGLSKVMVYEGYYPDDILNRMATDNLAQQLSSSWGYPIDATTEQIFKQFIAQGQTMTQASGDSGVYSGGVMTPSDDPNLTVVGGTSLTTSGAGGPWSAESAWSGSGGGISTTYPIPSYQQGFSMAASGGSTTMRNIPDVALTADIQMYLIFNNGQVTGVGGTSAAAPLWAGFIALANQQAAANGKSRIGFLNPLVYTIGNSSNYASDFHDIIHGSNGRPAVTGYDLATGWGSPAGQHLISDLTGTAAGPSFTLASSAAALSIQKAGTGSATLTVTAQNGFNSSVALAVTGLPSGVTAAFSPASATKTSTVTFTVSASAAAGTYPLTIKGTSGTLSSTAAISLSVVAPGFTVSSSAASLTVRQGATGNSTVTVSDQGGFSGSVSLAVTGLPSGVTAALSPASATGASTATFTVSASAAVGTYPLTVKGTSGTLSATAAITLSVVAPNFVLSASSAGLSISQTGSGSDTIMVGAQSGFSGSVSLAATGLPTGVTVSFSPASTSTTSLLTVNASSATPAGSYSVTVTGTCGSLTSTVKIALSITAPVFVLAFEPINLGLARGETAGGTLILIAQKSITGVALTVSGLPIGVTASFGAWSATGTCEGLFTASNATVTGKYTVIVKGVSNGLTTSTIFTLAVLAPTANTTLVNLSPVYNINALATDGLPFSGGGLDGGMNGTSTAYSANLMGAQQVLFGTMAGTVFALGPANVLDAVSSRTVSLPAGQYSAIKLLATAVNGNQYAQGFKVTYTDGSATTFTQSVSDWFTPQFFSGETIAQIMPYRDTGPGQLDVRTFYLYEYSFTLNTSKTVASITLPNTRNVVMLAATLTNATGSARSSLAK